MAKRIMVFASVLMVSALPVMCFAADPEPIDVTGVFSAVTSQVTTTITNVLPYAAVILAAMLAISLGMKIYRRVTGR